MALIKTAGGVAPPTEIHFLGELVMKRHLFPSVEGLEAKSLLSQFGFAMAAMEQPVAHVTPRASTNAQSQLAITLTTNQSSYTVGQNVQMTMTATNDTNHDVTVGVGPSTTVFSISQNGHVIWRSPSEPQYIEKRVLAPGESFTVTANWTATATGNFVVSNQMAPQGPVAMFSVTPSGPASAVAVAADPPTASPISPAESPQATNAASGVAFTFTTNESSYTLGQNVRMTLTGTNDTNHDVTVGVGPSTTVFSISQNGHVIWRSPSEPQYIEKRVLAPGQSFTVTANWTSTATGNFVVSNQMAPQGPVAMFSVTAS